MKRIITTSILSLLLIRLLAQDKPDPIGDIPESNINLNLLGDASLISINYERLFFVNSTSFLTGKIGVGYNEEFQLCIWGPCSPSEKYLTIPHHITGNLGSGRRFIEFGLGGTIISGNTNQNYLLYPIVGYRQLLLESNTVNFRIFGSIPFSGLDTEDILFVPIGLSVGISL